MKHVAGHLRACGARSIAQTDGLIDHPGGLNTLGTHAMDKPLGGGDAAVHARHDGDEFDRCRVINQAGLTGQDLSTARCAGEQGRQQAVG